MKYMKVALDLKETVQESLRGANINVFYIKDDSHKITKDEGYYRFVASYMGHAFGFLFDDTDLSILRVNEVAGFVVDDMKEVML